MSPQQRKDRFDLWMARVNRHGWPAVILIVVASMGGMCLSWARQHADGFILDMRDTMKRSTVAIESQAVTQARQAEISAATRDSIQRMDSRIDQTHGLVRDIHDRLKPLQVGSAEPLVQPDECRDPDAP